MPDGILLRMVQCLYWDAGVAGQINDGGVPSMAVTGGHIYALKKQGKR